MLNVLPLLLPVAGLPPPAGPSGAAAAGLSDAIYGRQGPTKQFRYRQAVPRDSSLAPHSTHAFIEEGITQKRR